MTVEPDKLRFLDQEQTDYSVTAVEVSDGRSLENFITIWIRPGHENTLFVEIGSEIWANLNDRFRHDPSIFHRDNEDSTWSITRHHYHISYDHQPTKQDVLELLALIDSVKDKKYISPELLQSVQSCATL